ncbi:MAG: UDP-N-acetylmuramate dehydrogenase [Actinomycetota bacterium]
MSGGVAAAAEILRAACGDRLRERVSIAPLTTFRLGGPAALYLEPESLDDLRAIARAVAATDIAVVVLGKGSNVLVSDAGVDGLVLRLGRGFRWAAREGSHLTAGGAMPLPALAGIALSHGLAGLEFGIAIPATLGGAVRMNAGAHGRSLADVVERVDVFDLRDGGVRSVEAPDAGFRYRGSEFGESAVVVGARLGLEPGDRDAIRTRMDEARAWRRETQPVAEPNCGSVFKNPEGAHAARLVEEAGCKGLAVGGASVSRKHANFIVAGEGARADDVARLIAAVRDAVRERTGIELEPEVRFLGAFDARS